MTPRRTMVLGLLVLAGCAPAVVSAPPVNAPPPPSSGAGAAASSRTSSAPSTRSGPPALPPMPEVTGAPLAIRVIYPSQGQTITARDSNFIHGSVGSGDAKLTINGIDVAVSPNGAFLAWIPVPPPGTSTYTLVATRGNERAEHVLRVRLASSRPPLSPAGRLRVDSQTVSPSPSQRLRLRSDELVRISVRAPGNASVWAESSNGTRIRPLVALPLLREIARQASRGVPDPAAGEAPALNDSVDAAAVFQTDLRASQLASGARLVIARAADTVRLPVARPTLADAGLPLVAVLRNTNAAMSDTDRVVVGRPTPDGTYKWLLLSGTAVEVTGAQGSFSRVKLDDNLEVWVSDSDLALLPEGAVVPRRVTGGFRVTPGDEWVDVSIPIGERPAFFVEPGDRSLTLTLYDTQANPEISPILANDTLIRRISWIQEGTDRLRINFSLSQPVYGWLSVWDESRRAFVLRVRRLPRINVQRPLEGLRIVVDAGHPPAGATGPTGLYEGDAVLPVAERMAELLKLRGATAIMTRTTLEPYGLVERTVAARRADANAFVSIHLNALPDGVNPFTNNGTSTLFFHQNSEPLARYTQEAMMKRFPLRDLGVHYQNLAVARTTWYPSVLAEGLFIMIPEQEAAMRDSAFQELYAEALVEGLERYFRELAGR